MSDGRKSLPHASPANGKVLLAGILSLAVLRGVAFANASQTQELSPSGPSVINLTYSVTEFITGAATIHLHEEDGQLTKDEKSKDGERTESVKYQNVEYVALADDSLKTGAKKRVVHIEDSNGKDVFIPLRTESEAKAVAEYVGRKSSLELIGDAWRVRKPFACPEGIHLGCEGFKEMLDHDDLDIVEYFYSRDPKSHTYACFNDESKDFFVLQYSHLPSISGDFHQEAFHDGQSIGANSASIDWLRADLGQLRTDELELKPGQKPQAFGSIDPSSLVFERKGGIIKYSLKVRWSTRRYTESFSGKDDNGKVTDNESSGLCSKLN